LNINRRNRLRLDWCRPDRLRLLAPIGLAPIAAKLAASICIPAIGFALIAASFSPFLQ
jgi:hypothetical protein